MKNHATELENTTRRFHRSLYISLALACACMAYAEWLFLPELTIFSGIVGVLLYIGYRCENRWSLSLRAANVVGAVIVVILALWGLFQVIRPHGTLLNSVPMPAKMLPFLGALVLILIPAKLFRPKHAGDYWSLQLIGLLTVALACALAGDGVTAVLVFFYLASAACCVADFHAVIGRGSGRLDSNMPERRPTLFQVGIWAILASGIAMLFSLLTPRSVDAQWEMSSLSSRHRIGYAEDRNLIDLNVSGELQSSSEVAFEVRAETADGQPKLDLPSTQKWRGTSFNYYDQGRWTNRGWSSRSFNPNRDRIPGELRERMFRPPDPTGELPDLGPHKYFLIFPTPERPRGTYFLAEPIWPPRSWVGQFPAAPVITETDAGGRFAWRARPEGDVYPPPIIPGGWTKAHYRQVTAPTPERGLSAAVRIDSAFAEHLTVLVGLRHLRSFSNSLLQTLIDERRLPKYPNWTPGTPVGTERHEEVARAIDNYLHSGGRFEYSLTLKRDDPNLDPIEDFLLNVREGHCNRFATALTLLLRSQGIPARIVLGFEGLESNGDGSYVVRQANAHSWVEALIRRPSPDGEPTWHWLTLDPSPPFQRAAVVESAWVRWVGELGRDIVIFLRSFILELNADRQDKAREALAALSPTIWGPQLIEFLSTPLGWATVCAPIFGVWYLRRRQTHAVSAKPKYHYQKLRESVRRSNLVLVRPGTTPKELGRRFANVLSDQDDSIKQATQQIIKHHDETCYGGRQASPTELRQLATSLSVVEKYCRQHRRKQVVHA